MEKPAPKRNQKLVKLDDETNYRLTEYRFTNRFKGESAAIRELMRLGFETLQERGLFAG